VEESDAVQRVNPTVLKCNQNNLDQVACNTQ